MTILSPISTPMTRNDTTPAAHRRPAQAPLTLALVNDYEVVVRGLESMLAPFADRVQIIELEIEGTPDLPADVALFDTYGCPSDPLERARRMVDERQVSHVVLYTWDPDTRARASAAAAGVSGLILKSSCGRELVEQIERVVRGERVGLESPCTPPLLSRITPREHQVLALIAQGRSNQAIAAELFLSLDTVKSHVSRLLQKLGATNRTELALIALGHAAV